MTAALSNMGISSLLSLPSITNKPPPVSSQSNMALEEVKRKVAKQANSISIKEFTDVREYSACDIYFIYWSFTAHREQSTGCYNLECEDNLEYLICK